jgi:hypothetical protein
MRLPTFGPRPCTRLFHDLSVFNSCSILLYAGATLPSSTCETTSIAQPFFSLPSSIALNLLPERLLSFCPKPYLYQPVAWLITANMADPDVDEDLFADLYVSKFETHEHIIDVNQL